MAGFNADILLNVSSTKAEKAIQQVEKSLAKVERRASDIDVKFDVDDAHIRRAKKLLDSLTRVRRVKVVVDEQVRRSGGGSGGSNAGSIGAGSTVAGLLPAAASAGAITALPKALQAATQQSSALATTVKEVTLSFQDVVALAQRQYELMLKAEKAEQDIKIP